MLIRPLDERQSLSAQASSIENGHFVPTPEWGVFEDEELIGAFNVKCPPFLFFWMKEGVATAMHSLKAFKAAEKEIASKGWRTVALPIQTTSPFYEFVPKLGYEEDSTSRVLIKCATSK